MWLFPLHYKLEAFIVFKQFKALIENKFERKIKTLRSDGGGEYMSSEFKRCLNDYGIQHQITCPHTPEQNGIIEHKHRHIVEIGLAVLDFAHLPKHFWLEAFSTSIYLINCMLIKVNNDLDYSKTPYEYLFNESLDYSHLHSFGGLCYLWLHPYSKNKLDNRSTKCIFLGYNLQQKGYKCYYYVNKKKYASRHVVFHDEIFPFKDQITKGNKSDPRYTESDRNSWFLSLEP
jgi:histone deacetylase 1/2